jgi:hypothetical protein
MYALGEVVQKQVGDDSSRSSRRRGIERSKQLPWHNAAEGVAMKIIAYILKVRLVTISEALPHEMQNGSRPGRITSDGTFNVRLVLQKLKEHGHSRAGCFCWTSTRLSTVCRGS